MIEQEIFTAIIIHLVLPVTGLLFYLGLIRKMKREKVESPPTIDLFLIFATYGGLLLVALTTFFWKWSGMASLGTFYLILGAPLVMSILTYKNYKNRKLSKYHRWTYMSGLFYFLITPLTLMTIMALE